MSLEFYKLIHVIGIVLLFSGLVSLVVAKMINNEIPKKIRMLGFISHGVGVLFLLVSGFGMLARLGIMTTWPTWAIVKLVIWLFFALAAVIIKRKAQLGTPALVSMLIIFMLAGYLALYKPF